MQPLDGDGIVLLDESAGEEVYIPAIAVEATINAMVKVAADQGISVVVAPVLRSVEVNE